MMGTKIAEFEIPVCNSFRAKLVKDQLCYEVDLSRFKNHINFKDKLFLTLLIDYNEDREIKKNEYPKENFVIINTVRRFYFATAVFALFLCEILIKFYTQWQF